MKLFILALSLFSTVALSEMIPGAASSPASFPSGLSTSSTDCSGQNVCAASYTPVYTMRGGSNTSFGSIAASSYIRIGNVVTMSGYFLNTDNAGNPASNDQIGISLPVSSNFDAVGDCSGSWGSNSSTQSNNYVLADTTNDECLLSYDTTGNGSSFTTYVVQYIIK